MSRVVGLIMLLPVAVCLLYWLRRVVLVLALIAYIALVVFLVIRNTVAS